MDEWQSSFLSMGRGSGINNSRKHRTALQKSQKCNQDKKANMKTLDNQGEKCGT